MVGVVATVAVLAIPIIPTGLSEASDVQVMGWIAIALIPLCFGLVAWRVPEPIAADVHSHRFPLSDYLAMRQSRRSCACSSLRPA